MRRCAAEACDNPVPMAERGRPPIYCSPACRPSRRSTGRRRITVELTNPPVSPDGRPLQRVWLVSLRRADLVVTVAENLGWPSASALAAQLEEILYSDRKERRAAS
ncbi:MAG TPA: hypothetical protein VFH70_08705 [Acidimicrobiales bacterium]|nr:hypothetical protein [Acidimicrobiales bacterium]